MTLLRPYIGLLIIKSYFMCLATWRSEVKSLCMYAVHILLGKKQTHNLETLLLGVFQDVYPRSTCNVLVVPR